MSPSVRPSLRLPTAGTGPVRPTRDASGAATSRWSGGRVSVAGGGLQRRASVALGSRPRRSAGPRTRSGRPRPVEQHEFASRGSYQSDVPRHHLQRLTTPFSDPPTRRRATLRAAAADHRRPWASTRRKARRGRITSKRPRRLAARHRGVRWAPLNTSAAQITLEAGSAAVKCPSPESRRRPPRQVRRPNRRSDRSQRHHISRGDLRAPF